MVNKKNKYKEQGSLKNFLILFIFVTFFLILLIILYLIYTSIPVEPEPLYAIVDSFSQVQNNISSEIFQFYPNMKFNRNKITYRIDYQCSEEKKIRTEKAFNEISINVNILSFKEVFENPDIEVICSDGKKQQVNEKYFIAGEGGAKEIIQTGKYNIIISGLIFLYDNPKNFIKCEYPNIELHEIMHVFGFNHTENKNSLMYYYLDSCRQKMDSFLINELKRLYSEENLPDLYFEDVKIIKKGRYLDFNLTIKNSGSIDADNASFSVFDDGELVETRKIGDLKFGAGIFIETRNLKLINRNPEEIVFEIDAKKLIKEFDKTNNIARVNLAE